MLLFGKLLALSFVKLEVKDALSLILLLLQLLNLSGSILLRYQKDQISLPMQREFSLNTFYNL